jgi:DNA primase
MPEEDFEEKIFVMGEDIHSSVVEGYIRQMQSENRITRDVVTKDNQTGEMNTVHKTHKVRIVFMTTSTKLDVNIENISRCILIKVDESKDQTEDVLHLQRIGTGHLSQLDKRHLVPIIARRHIAAQSLLKNVNIYNSFAGYIRFPSHKAIFRRSQPYFLILINTVCFWRQYQKESVMKHNPYTKRDEEWYECDLTDYEVARELFLKSNLLSYVDELPERLIELYEDIRKMVKEKAEKNGLNVTETAFIQREVREITHLSNESIKKYLRKLVDYEYIQLTGGKRHGTRFSYRLREDAPIDRINTSEIIPTAEQIKTMIDQESKQD